jgi:hypothetical protein
MKEYLPGICEERKNITYFLYLKVRKDFKNNQNQIKTILKLHKEREIKKYRKREEKSKNTRMKFV